MKLLNILCPLLILSCACAPERSTYVARKHVAVRSNTPFMKRSTLCQTPMRCYQAALASYRLGGASNLRRANKLFDRACVMGHSKGCISLAAHLLLGKGIAPNASRAARLFERTCHHNSGDGCMRLGALYEVGWGVRLSQKRAMNLYMLGCKLGSQQGCQLGLLLANKRARHTRRARTY